MSHIRNSPVGKAVGESLPFILPVFILAAGKVRKARARGCVCVLLLPLLLLLLLVGLQTTTPRPRHS